MKILFHLFLVLPFLSFYCTGAPETVQDNKETPLSDKPIIKVEVPENQMITTFDKDTKTIHILVALCDNENQGIVPVPERMGNGQDPNNNLYWGAAYGMKTYFKRSEEWKLLSLRKPNDTILERAIYKHETKNYYLVADAYDGRYIKNTTEQFLKSCYGMVKDTVKIGDRTLGIAGNSKMLGYIGHDGLMEFEITTPLKKADELERNVIILACVSKEYFAPYLAKANVNPLVWTTNLMAPEAYTIHDGLSGYVRGETNNQIRLRAAKAYAKYQKCGLKGAKRLLVSSE